MSEELRYLVIIFHLLKRKNTLKFSKIIFINIQRLNAINADILT